MYCRTLDGVTPRYAAASSVVKYLLMRKEYTRCDRPTQSGVPNKGLRGASSPLRGLDAPELQR